MGHIAEWERIDGNRKKREAAREVTEREEEKRRIESIKAFLAKHDADFVFTNGYVYNFDYKGMSCEFCDQEFRIAGEIHRPFTSDKDRKRYSDMEEDWIISDGWANNLVEEYAFNQFCIDGEPTVALHQVFKLIENVVAIREGCEG